MGPGISWALFNLGSVFGGSGGHGWWVIGLAAGAERSRFGTPVTWPGQQ